jgi:hypothetical protein
MALRKTTHQKRPRSKKTQPARPLSERIAEMGKSIPATELARWPKDGAANFDAYVDGSRKPAR